MRAVPDDKHIPGWQADLRLKFGVGSLHPRVGEQTLQPQLLAKGAGPADTRTRLLERRHKGPLVIQRPFHPEGDPCHVYLVHPPGGVVGGDELRVDVDVEPRAHALITTPAATKFYRCPGRHSSQRQELRVNGATLEWLPQENIFYRGAHAHTVTQVHLAGDAKFIGWEIACLGLPARGESFDAGALRLDLELWRASGGVDLPVFIDWLRLAGDSRARAARWGLGGFTAVGTLLATPASEAQRDQVRELCAGFPQAGVSLVDGVLVLRALAAQGETVRKLFNEAWCKLRPAIIGREAAPPRIWAT